MGKVVCFTGHREIPKEHRRRLDGILNQCLEALIAEGADCFRTGGAMGFDTAAAMAVLRARKKHPEVRLNLILPCQDQAKKWPLFSKYTYDYIRKRADSVEYIAERYNAYCMLARNRALVNGSDICVAYQTSPKGGTAYTVDYAASHGVEVRNLAEQLISGKTVTEAGTVTKKEKETETV